MTDSFTVLHPEIRILDAFNPVIPSDYGILYVTNSLPSDIDMLAISEFLNSPFYSSSGIPETHETPEIPETPDLTDLTDLSDSDNETLSTTSNINEKINHSKNDDNEDYDENDDGEFALFLGIGILYASAVSGLLFYSISNHLGWRIEF